MILSTSLRPFVSVGAWVIFFYPALQVDSCLRYPPFQNTRGLIARTREDNALNSPSTNVTHLGTFSGRDPFFAARLSPTDHNQSVSLCVTCTAFFFLVCVCECVCGRSRLVNLCWRVTLSVLGAHGMEGPVAVSGALR